MLEGTFLDRETIVPHCGYQNVKVASHKPWNEKSINFSFLHFLKHIGSSLKRFTKLNKSFPIVFISFILVVATFTILGSIPFRDSFFAILVVVALILGLVTRMSRQEIRLESLQVWFRDAYGLMVPYNEIVLALTNLYAGADKHQMSNQGYLVHVNGGIVYEQPFEGEHNHMPIEKSA